MISSEDRLDFTIVLHAILDGLGELRHIVLGGIGGTSDIVLGNSMKDSSEGLNGEGGTGIIETGNNSSGIRLASLFEETVEEELKSLLIILQVLSGSATTKYFLGDLTSDLTNRDEVSRLEIRISSDSIFMDFKQMSEGVIGDLALDLIQGETSKSVNLITFLHFFSLV